MKNVQSYLTKEGLKYMIRWYIYYYLFRYRRYISTKLIIIFNYYYYLNDYYKKHLNYQSLDSDGNELS